jgi:hypothetical protein
MGQEKQFPVGKVNQFHARRFVLFQINTGFSVWRF